MSERRIQFINMVGTITCFIASLVVYGLYLPAGLFTIWGSPLPLSKAAPSLFQALVGFWQSIGTIEYSTLFFVMFFIVYLFQIIFFIITAAWAGRVFFAIKKLIEGIGAVFLSAFSYALFLVCATVEGYMAKYFAIMIIFLLTVAAWGVFLRAFGHRGL